MKYQYFKRPLASLTFFILSTLTIPLVAHAQNPANQLKYNHDAVCSSNLKRSVDFYANVLQLEKIPNPFTDTVHQWFKIGPGIALHVIQGNCPAVSHDINTHLCFSVPSLETFMKHLDVMNITYGDWKGNPKKTLLRADGVLQIYFQDPDGYWIEVNNAR